MISKKIYQLKGFFKKLGIDGYIVPKNDEFFSEYSKVNKLKLISNFSGSAGYAVILKNKNYLFVDGRYTIQAQKESGKYFKITKYEKIFNCNLFNNLTLGINPRLFTSEQVKRFFGKKTIIRQINSDLIENIFRKSPNKQKPFFSLKKSISGESHKKKIGKVVDWLKKERSNYLFISAPENVAWLLNIRGYDNPHSPIPNCRLLIDIKKKIFLVSEKNSARKLIKEKKIKNYQLINPQKFDELLNKLEKGKIIIDSKSCSLFFENLFKKKFKVIKKEDPI